MVWIVADPDIPGRMMTSALTVTATRTGETANSGGPSGELRAGPQGDSWPAISIALLV